MEYMGVTAARERLSSLIDSTDRTVIVRNNEPRAVILSIDDYRSLVLSQARQADPEHVTDLLARHEAVQRGDLSGTVDFSEGDADDLLQLVRERSLAEAD